MKSLDLVRTYVQADQPVLVWGLPGTGKTASIAALARDRGAHLEVLIGSTIDPVDVGGYLIPHGGSVVCDPPSWAKRLRAALDAGQQAWLFFDELSCAPPSVQAALLRVANERMVAALDLSGVRMLAAANPPETATAEGDVGSAMANRWAHVDWKLDSGDWSAGTLSGWGNKQPHAYHAIAGSVVGYLCRNSSALLGDVVAGGRPWPSPRSWTAAIRTLVAFGGDIKSADARQLVAGCVGDAAAQEWSTYAAVSDLPDPEAVLAGTAELPKRGDQLSACLMSVASVALSDRPDKEDRVSRAWTLMSGARHDLVVVPARALLSGSDQVPPVAVELGNKLRGMS